MLINCVACQDGTKLADCPIDDIGEYLKRPGCFVWVALKDATPEDQIFEPRLGRANIERLYEVMRLAPHERWTTPAPTPTR